MKDRTEVKEKENVLNGYSLVLYCVSLSLYLHSRRWKDLVGIRLFNRNSNLYCVSNNI